MRKLLCTLLIFSLAVSLAAGLSGCGETDNQGNFSLYFRDQTKYELVAVRAEVDTGAELDRVISAVWARMCDSSEGSGYISAVPAGLTLKNFYVDENNLVLNFSKEYPAVYTPEELILRAAVVKTFSQLDIVSSVEFYVDSQMLADADGNVLGPQKRMHFVDLMEQGLNDYNFTTTVLYYANAAGDALIPVQEELTYRSDISLAQHVVGRLIVGASEAGAYRVLPADTKIISVSTKDGVCYVSLNNALASVEFTVAPEIIIYSIVNSLTELSGISSVQITVNGSSGLFHGVIDLSKPFVRNLDYVEMPEKNTEE